MKSITEKATAAAVLEDKTALFQLVTEPMIHKAPLLRDYLKAECKIGSSDYSLTLMVTLV